MVDGCFHFLIYCIYIFIQSRRDCGMDHFEAQKLFRLIKQAEMLQKIALDLKALFF